MSVEILSKESRKALKDSLYEFDKKMWDLITYSRDSDALKYNPDFLTTNEGLHLRASRYLSELKEKLNEHDVFHQSFEKAHKYGLLNINKIKAGQSRSHLRWHLNNARCELIDEMKKNWTSVRINVEYLHPNI